jgi:hypothetical protein
MVQPGQELAARITKDWVSFWNTYDLDLVEKLFLTDARVSYFSSEKQGVIKGIDALKKHHEGFGFVRGGKTQGNRLWLEDLDAQIIEPVVVITAIWHFQRQNADTVQKGPVTLVYTQVGNEYRLWHGHFANYP